MRAITAMLFGFCVVVLASGGAFAGGRGDGGAVVLQPHSPIHQANTATITEAANVLVLQEPPRSANRGDGFISIDTVVIGCTAGAAAGALAIALPVMTVASSGIGLPASASAIISTAGIGCAVGVVSGLAAIGTAWGLNLMNSGSGSN